MKRKDIILIGILLSVAAIFYLLLNVGRTTGDLAVVTVDGERYQTLDLQIDQNIIIEGNGRINEIMVKNQSVSMKNASCPDKICVKHKRISKNRETIVCLPNKVVVEIQNNKTNELDVIAGL